MFIFPNNAFIFLEGPASFSLEGEIRIFPPSLLFYFLEMMCRLFVRSAPSSLYVLALWHGLQ